MVRFPLSVGFEALFFGLFVVSFISLCRVTGPAPTSWLGGFRLAINNDVTHVCYADANLQKCATQVISQIIEN